LAAGFFDHPVAQRADQAVAFGQGHKFVGADHAAHRVLPAQQGLGAGDLAAVRIDLGLEVQLEGMLAMALRSSCSSSASGEPSPSRASE
jgi:hypothetical protein